jgi:hypothetical protein
MEHNDDSSGFQLKLLHAPISKSDDNVDIEVTLAGGERFTATFTTLKNIATIMERYRQSGECLAGKYFWASELIVVDELNVALIRKVVSDPLKSGELSRAFGGPHE